MPEVIRQMADFCPHSGGHRSDRTKTILAAEKEISPAEPG
jgi:hypothetical protein